MLFVAPPGAVTKVTVTSTGIEVPFFSNARPVAAPGRTGSRHSLDNILYSREKRRGRLPGNFFRAVSGK